MKSESENTSQTDNYSDAPCWSTPMSRRNCTKVVHGLKSTGLIVLQYVTSIERLKKENKHWTSLKTIDEVLFDRQRESEK